MLKNCITTCRQILKHCPDAHLNTCQPLTFTSKFQLTEGAINKVGFRLRERETSICLLWLKNDTKSHVT